LLYVKDVMSQRVRTIRSSATVLDAAKLMARSRIGSLVVVVGEKPARIITEGDISKAVARGLNPAKTPVGFMRRRLLTVGPDRRVEEAARTMATEGVKKLPVIDEGRLVGIVTQSDIVGSSFDLVTSLKEMVRARYRPPDFEP